MASNVAALSSVRDPVDLDGDAALPPSVLLVLWDDNGRVGGGRVGLLKDPFPLRAPDRVLSLALDIWFRYTTPSCVPPGVAVVSLRGLAPLLDWGLVVPSELAERETVGTDALSSVGDVFALALLEDSGGGREGGPEVTRPEDRLLLFARSLGPIGFGGAARESCGDVYPVGRAGRTGLN